MTCACLARVCTGACRTARTSPRVYLLSSTPDDLPHASVQPVIATDAIFQPEVAEVQPAMLRKTVSEAALAASFAASTADPPQPAPAARLRACKTLATAAVAEPVAGPSNWAAEVSLAAAAVTDRHGPAVSGCIAAGVRRGLRVVSVALAGPTVLHAVLERIVVLVIVSLCSSSVSRVAHLFSSRLCVCVLAARMIQLAMLCARTTAAVRHVRSITSCCGVRL